MIEYVQGSSDPTLPVIWRDWTGALVDFSNVGYSFELKLGNLSRTSTVFTKSTGITGAAGSLLTSPPTPNLVVSWDTTGELTTVDVGTWLIQISATSPASHTRRTQFPILVTSALP